MGRQAKGENTLAANHHLVLDALKQAEGPLTAYDVIDRVRAAGISAPPTVYRALARLIAEGLVHRLESLNAFVACTQPHQPHGTAVFAICRECRSFIEFTDERIATRLSRRAAEYDFVIEQATVELRGRCRRCADSPP